MMLVTGLAIWATGVGIALIAPMLIPDLRVAYNAILTTGTEKEQRQHLAMFIVCIFFWPLVLTALVLDAYLNSDDPGPPTGW